MQIRLGTARAMGYSGSAEGLLDAQTNMTYAVRYLAGAYRAAGGNESRAVALYAGGYYEQAKYQAKAQGFSPQDLSSHETAQASTSQPGYGSGDSGGYRQSAIQQQGMAPRYSQAKVQDKIQDRFDQAQYDQPQYQQVRYDQVRYPRPSRSRYVEANYGDGYVAAARPQFSETAGFGTAWQHGLCASTPILSGCNRRASLRHHAVRQKMLRRAGRGLRCLPIRVRAALKLPERCN